MCKGTDFWDYVQDATADTLTAIVMVGDAFYKRVTISNKLVLNKL